jgi:hypothetical protein
MSRIARNLPLSNAKALFLVLLVIATATNAEAAWLYREGGLTRFYDLIDSFFGFFSHLSGATTDFLSGSGVIDVPHNPVAGNGVIDVPHGK